MKRIIVFIFVVLFAALFLLSWLPRVYDKPFGKVLSTIGQVGMAISLIVLFLFPRKKEIPPARNNGDEAS